jgi:hypothetical protein
VGPEAAVTTTLHWFETELLTNEENLIGLMALNRETLGQTESLDGSDPLGNLRRRLVLPKGIDSWRWIRLGIACGCLLGLIGACVYPLIQVMNILVPPFELLLMPLQQACVSMAT